jgi:hypothetical protein
MGFQHVTQVAQYGTALEAQCPYHRQDPLYELAAERVRSP